MKRLLVFLVLIGFTLIGCSNSSENVEHNEEISKTLSDYFDCQFSVCTESQMDKFYNKLEDKSEIEAITKACRIESVSDDGSAVIELPDVNSIMQQIQEDAGFKSDFKKGVNKEDVCREYFFSFLKKSNKPMITKTVSVDVSDGKLKSDAELFQLIKQIYETKFIEQLDMSGKHKIEFPKVTSDSTFCFSQNNKNIMVSDVRISTGSGAIQKLHGLSVINESFKTNDAAYFIEYSVMNLSSDKVKVHDCFKAVTEDGIILYPDSKIGGLTNEVTLNAGQTKQMNSFVIGSNRIVWFSTDTDGAYELSQ